jgi:hypothetical protein
MENLLRTIEIQQREGHDCLRKCTNYTYESWCLMQAIFGVIEILNISI